MLAQHNHKQFVDPTLVWVEKTTSVGPRQQQQQKQSHAACWIEAKLIQVNIVNQNWKREKFN